jgi:Trm5-related predicted tRNA methylase
MKSCDLIRRKSRTARASRNEIPVEIDGVMAKSKQQRDPLPDHFPNVEAAAEFWDTHDLADYADLTTEVEATIDLQRRYLFALEPELAAQIVEVARRRGLSAETLINLWLSERLRASAA